MTDQSRHSDEVVVNIDPADSQTADLDGVKGPDPQWWDDHDARPAEADYEDGRLKGPDPSVWPVDG